MIHVLRRVNEDTCIVFDDETLALMEVDDQTAHLLVSGVPATESGDNAELPQDMRDALESIKTLKESGVVCLEGGITAQTSEPELAYLLLNVSHACDMNCVYCFGQGGSYGGPVELMSEEVARRAIDLLAASPAKGGKRIALFGGEPLMNAKLVEFILAYGREVIGDKTKLAFSISTNGTMLTPEMARLLKDHEVSTQISIDGTRELQNHLRPLRNGSDSFDAVSASLQKCLPVNPALHGRATVTNLCSDAMDLAAQLFSMGFRSISLQPVHGCKTLELTEGQLRELGDGYRMLARRGLARKVSWLDSAMRRIRARSRNEVFCGAGWRGLTVAPDGKFYLCHRLVPLVDFEVGDVWAGVNQAKLRDLLRGMESVECSLVCSSCMYRHLCGGGCMAENYFETGRLREPWKDRCLLTKAVCGAALDAYIDEFYRATKSAGDPSSADQKSTEEVQNPVEREKAAVAVE